MTNAPLHLQPAVAQSLDKWHAMIERKDFGALESIGHTAAVFR